MATEGSFVEVIAGCKTLAGDCVNIRTGPGTDYRAIRTVRIGTILEVEGVAYRDGHAWYRVKHDHNLRYPERVKGDWYLASEYTKMHVIGEVVYAQGGEHTNKKIVVSLKNQTLYAYEGDQLFLSAKVSTGIKTTPTPKGVFSIFKKQPSRYMQGPLPGISKKEYDLPGVPWTMYFTKDGAAIHGTYWHNAFGKPHSNGCINLPVDIAESLYMWAPIGTPVIVKS
jgi:hypothetical protein